MNLRIAFKRALDHLSRYATGLRKGLSKRPRTAKMIGVAAISLPSLGIGFWLATVAPIGVGSSLSDASHLKQLQAGIKTSADENVNDSVSSVLETNISGAAASSGVFVLVGTVETVTDDGLVLNTVSGNRVFILTSAAQTNFRANSIKPAGQPLSIKPQAGQTIRVTCKVEPAGQFLATSLTAVKAGSR